MDIDDRTDELIDAMLLRRARRPVPADLLTRTVGAAATERQAGGRGRGAGGRGTIGRPWVLLAGIVVLAAALVAGFVGVRVLRDGGSRAPGQGAVGTAVPSPSLATPAVAGSASPVASAPVALAPDTIAVVSDEGFDLRVRTAPGVGTDSRKLRPLLASGTRLLVIGGPVAASGYDWYEVMVEDLPDAMYGWVASGKDGVPWIEPAVARCRPVADAAAVAEMRPFDFLVCFGGQLVTLTASWNEAQSGVDVGCPWLDRVPCDFEQGWLLAPVHVSHRAADGTVQTIALAVPPSQERAMAEVPGDAGMSLTIAMDAPEARKCRITDPSTGKNLIAPNRVVTACRLAFVVRAVERAP